MRTNTVVLGLMVVLVVAIGLLVACGSPTPTQTGEELLQQTCTKCHSLDRIQQAQKTRNEWEQTYARMIAKGDPAVPVSEDELRYPDRASGGNLRAVEEGTDPAVTAPIIGPCTLEQLEGSLRALEGAH